MTRGRGTSKLALLIALFLVSLMVVFMVSAGATVPGPTCNTVNHVAGSNFEIEPDANLLDGSGDCIDWLAGGSGSSLMASVQLKNDKPTGSGDDSFGQGTSEDNANPTIVDGSIPPNKSDLKAFGVNSETTTSGKFLQLFWSRIQDPSGTTNMDFELNKEFCDGTAAHCADNGTKTPVYVTPKRSVGDKLITYDLSNGGTVPSISIRTWSGTAWGTATVISGAGGTSLGSVNTSTIAATNSGGLGELVAYTFGEASLSYAAVFGGQACGTFGSAYLKSRSSDSFTSALKDFVAPLPVTISNCATLTTGVAENVTIGTAINDTATLAGASNPSGTVTFKLYGPFTAADATADLCTAGNLLATNTGSALVGPDADGNYTSSTSYTPTAVGRYRWVANFVSGDANNTDAGPTACLDAAELDTVAKQQPTLATDAAESVIVGATINDRAILSGAAQTSGSVGGTISFKLYGPFTGAGTDVCDATTLLTTIAGSAPLTAGAGGTFTSTASYTPTAVGRYRWVASYTGDAKNEAAGPTACLDAAELDTVAKKQPTLATDAAQTVIVGATINDRAILSGAAQTSGAVGGTVSFKLYGPFTGGGTDQCDDATTLLTTIAGSALSGPDVNGKFTSTASYTPTAVGRYRWVATYTGDAKNEAAGPTACLDAAELDTVNPIVSGITTSQAWYPNDTATITGGGGGTVDFTLFGPFTAAQTPVCTGTPVVSALNRPVTVDGAVRSASTGNTTQAITLAGTYVWLVVYSGDATHTGATSSCGDEQFTLGVTNDSSP